MAKLSTKARNALSAAQFAGPDRSYPVPDASHAANAKARATQQVAAGNLTPGQKQTIDAKANKALHGKHNLSTRSGHVIHDAHAVMPPMAKHKGRGY